MKRIILLLAATLVIGVSVAEAQASAQAQGPTICYECKKMADYQYWDCWWPVATGHVSCIPGGSGCLVTDVCEASLASLIVTPDGSMKNSFLAAPALAVDMAKSRAGFRTGLLELASMRGDVNVKGPEVLKNCIELVAARVYTPVAARKISQQSRTIVL